MIRAISYSASCFAGLGVFSFVVLFSSGNLFAQSMTFDCPAVTSGQVVSESEDSIVVEVPVFVTANVADTRLQLNKVRAEVTWNRMGYPLIEYGPKTMLQSKVNGAINVEERLESNLNFTGSLAGGYLASVGTPNLNGNASRKKTKSTRYEKVPEHELVVSSGPINRGTGAYFEFKPTLTETLEGGRSLVVAFEVPVTWKGGILQITCHASGNRRKMGVFNDGFTYSRVFIVPVYLKGDDQAFRYATDLARSEQRLRTDWNRHRSSIKNKGSWLGLFQRGPADEDPDLWMHHLIQSGSDRALRQVESRLPARVADSANRFVEARRQILLLSR